MSFLFAALAAQPGRGGAGGGAELDLGALMGALGGMGGGPPGQGGPAMKPIHELLMGVMDADKSGGVSLQEALAALSAWESFSSFGAGPDGKPPESAALIAKAKEAAPAIFGLLGCLLVELLCSWGSIVDPATQLAKLLALVVAALMLGLLPYISNWAHIGGLAFGALCAPMLLPARSLGGPGWAGRCRNVAATAASVATTSLQ